MMHVTLLLYHTQITMFVYFWKYQETSGHFFCIMNRKSHWEIFSIGTYMLWDWYTTSGPAVLPEDKTLASTDALDLQMLKEKLTTAEETIRRQEQQIMEMKQRVI